MFKFFLSNEGFGGRIETTNNGGGFGGSDSRPGKDLSGELLELPGELLKQAVGVYNFGKTLCIFKLL